VELLNFKQYLEAGSNIGGTGGGAHYDQALIDTGSGRYMPPEEAARRQAHNAGIPITKSTTQKVDFPRKRKPTVMWAITPSEAEWDDDYENIAGNKVGNVEERIKRAGWKIESRLGNQLIISGPKSREEIEEKFGRGWMPHFWNPEMARRVQESEKS
jgi:hypothetical protein